MTFHSADYLCQEAQVGTWQQNKQAEAKKKVWGRGASKLIQMDSEWKEENDICTGATQAEWQQHEK